MDDEALREGLRASPNYAVWQIQLPGWTVVCTCVFFICTYVLVFSVHAYVCACVFCICICVGQDCGFVLSWFSSLLVFFAPGFVLYRTVRCVSKKADTSLTVQGRHWFHRSRQTLVSPFKADTGFTVQGRHWFHRSRQTLFGPFKADTSLTV